MNVCAASLERVHVLDEARRMGHRYRSSVVIRDSAEIDVVNEAGRLREY